MKTSSVKGEKKEKEKLTKPHLHVVWSLNRNVLLLLPLSQVDARYLVWSPSDILKCQLPISMETSLRTTSKNIFSATWRSSSRAQLPFATQSSRGRGNNSFQEGLLHRLDLAITRGGVRLLLWRAPPRFQYCLLSLCRHLIWKDPCAFFFLSWHGVGRVLECPKFPVSPDDFAAMSFKLLFDPLLPER